MLTPAAVRTALKNGRVTELLAALAAMGPATRAELFLKLRGPDQKAVLAAAPQEMAASILNECDSGSLPPVLAGIDLASIGHALRLIPPDSLADIVLHLPKELSERLQEQLDPELRAEVAKLLVFDPESAGGVMTPRYLSVPDVVTVQKATELLRTARDTGAQSYVYVVDVNGRLAGVAPLRALLLSPPR
jgi:magnesium transporter